MSVPYYDELQVEALLDYPGCIAAVRQAMVQLSQVDRDQPLRQIIGLGDGNLFGVMPGKLSGNDAFGAKLVSVFEDPARKGRSRHQGVVIDYDGRTGAVRCIADAEPVTRIRTACASAAATDALARPDAATLAIFGLGTQAEAHIHALLQVRRFSRILVWGRDSERSAAFAARMTAAVAAPVLAVGCGEQAASEADVITTVSSAAEPILFGSWVRPGTHINLVGSSFLGPVEVDSALVAAGRYIADYKPSVLAQAAELDVARRAGVVDNSHVVGEIGEVFSGSLAGREHDDQITIYKSLGNIVQDLAATAYLHSRATGETES
ncbi:ornithine cyclodeaminase [Sphingobium sp. AP50]|uniref:ornithine cyclodeaminase family protein n=1 Tax=Sphingobium sp. AP50 TaxID=1884369 RepID=UPI0008C43550|nr:ornithine cyclodeaminase family protein [Sphingobium sp. AP50]SEJ72380.1 ornithine cyclodeaminase [Sphingobium sp. AP50]